MKKVLFTLLCAMCVCGLNAVNYIDLGLPSGTLWAEQNEEGYFTYDEAVEQFGAALPTEEQFRELINECQRSWNGSGYTFVGPNGESLDMPASGRIAKYNGPKSRLNGTVEFEGERGYYWSSSYKKNRDGSSYSPQDAYCLYINTDQDVIDDGSARVFLSSQRKENKYSVRLVYVK